MSYMNKLVVALMVGCVGVMVTGCSTKQVLVMKSDLPLLDDSAISPRLKEVPCKKVMIIPPSGSARGTFENKLSLFEREFIRQGLTVISPAITGRVVMDSPDKSQEKKNETASNLSDMERALVMAKNTGTDIILQLGMFEWDRGSWQTRFFVADSSKDGVFREVSDAEYKTWQDIKLVFESPNLRCIGKVVNVENGEVLAMLSAVMPANYALPQDYHAEYYRYSSGDLALVSENYSYEPRSWEAQSMVNAEKRLIQYMVETISSVVSKKPR